MTIALRAHVASTRTDRLHDECSEALSAPPSCAHLLARLRVIADPSEGVSVNRPDDVVSGSGQGSVFIVADNACRRKDGRMAAVIGEPMLVADSGRGAMTSLNASDLLDLYETQGNACLETLHGSWAVVIVDPARARILLANDRMGRQTLYYSLGHNSVLIGSSLRGLRDHARTSRLDCQALYQYVYFHMVPAPGAVLNGYHKLGAASLLELHPGGHSLSRYWTPEFNETQTRSQASAHTELKVRLKAAVRRCIGADRTDGIEEKIGAFLSGGLDSSTVAGMLCELQGGSCDAYGIGFDVAGYDEMSYARIAARHFGIRLHEHRVSPAEVVQALPDLAAAFDEPFGNSSVVPAYFCARMAAQDGVDVLLAGDGGDELFAGNTRYAGQQIFEDYRKSPQWLRTHIIEPLLGSLPRNFPMVSKGRSFVQQASSALPKRLQHYGFLEQNRPDFVFMPEFLKSVDVGQPLELLCGIYEQPEDASILNRMLFMDWQITLADNDLRKVNQACALAGVGVRYPMLDDALVEFSTSIPSAWKLPGNNSRGRKLRHFYKQALSGWLPEATIKKGKHGFGLPFGVWMRSHRPLQELAFDNIIALKARGIFQSRFLDQAIVSHRDGHAAYYGELIWVLMCLELWLAANQPRYSLGQHT